MKNPYKPFLDINDLKVTLPTGERVLLKGGKFKSTNRTAPQIGQRRKKR
jgi:hypothetical protein